MSVETDKIPPVPEHTPPLKEDATGNELGKFFSQTWTRWFVSLRDKVNVIDTSLVNLSGISGTGVLVKNGVAWLTRTITGTSGRVTVTNGDGVSGNPTIDVVTGNLVAGTNVTLTGTLTNRLVGTGDVTIAASGGGGGAAYRVYGNQATTDQTGWGGYTARLVLNNVLLVSGTSIRLTLRGPTGATTTNINSMYIQTAAASGDPYDFSTTPVQAFFSGNPGIALTSGLVVQTTVSLTQNGLSNLVIAFDMTGTSSAREGTVSDVLSYFKNALDASTVNATGYTTSTARTVAIIKVEIL